ncbi:uncharacterized protein EMH_0055930 [Eimeria mitis]|uniref:Uncharacterized protein n=1 Tax=Eimeria mitis TaxID=44415 RepID=U6JXM5_9EIME|nr:uncharacterized protein EMH_0055930 [Eimeria mitis]CDJ30174.1 hypothetical protein EMH_0055930 [Eimeria mitis]
MTRKYHPIDVDSKESLAIFTSHAPPTSFERVEYVSPSNTRQPKAKDGHKLLRRGKHRSKFLVGALASIVSVVAILALLALCRTSQRRLNFGGSVRRNLSDTEDEDRMSRIIDQCLDLEEELGLGPAASPPNHRKSCKLRSDRYLESKGRSAMRFIASRGLEGEARPPPPKIPRLNESWVSSPHPQMSAGAFPSHPSGMAIGSAVSALDADAWVEEESELMLGEGGHQWYTTKEDTPGPELSRPLVSFSLGRAHSGDYAMMPDAWLEDSVANTDEQALQQMVVGTVTGHPKGETSSAASSSADSVGTFIKPTGGKPTGGVDHGVVRPAVGQESGGGMLVQMETGQRIDKPKGSIAFTSHALKESGSATAVGATSSGGGEPCMSKHIHQHPFVRLPAVNPEDIRRHFSEFIFLPFDRKADSPMGAYMIMRRLFAKPLLTAGDVETLMANAEQLVRYATFKLTRPDNIHAASRRFMKLSSLFMVFDHLVCTIELLGEKMDTDSWWPGFVTKFQTDYDLPEKARMKRTSMLSQLVNRLSRALSIYKQRRRPPLQEVIELKRLVIREAYNIGQMANPLWQLWMQDDKEFSSSSTAPDSLPDGRAHGQGEPKLP